MVARHLANNSHQCKLQWFLLQTCMKHSDSMTATTKTRPDLSNGSAGISPDGSTCDTVVRGIVAPMRRDVKFISPHSFGGSSPECLHLSELGSIRLIPFDSTFGQKKHSHLAALDSDHSTRLTRLGSLDSAWCSRPLPTRCFALRSSLASNAQWIALTVFSD